jgi:hypothetical protein
MAALEKGWIPRGSFKSRFLPNDTRCHYNSHNTHPFSPLFSLTGDPRIADACMHEDAGDFKCLIKKGQLDSTVQDAVAYVLKVQNLTSTTESQAALNLTGSALREKADEVVGEYFQKYKRAGATCDFGGVAQLVEESRVISDDDTVGYTDDEYYGLVINEGPSMTVLVIGALAVALASSLLGFVLAMRCSPSFNETVRKSKLFVPLSTSRNSLVRSSLNLPMLENYDEIQQVWEDDERQKFI